MGKNDNLLISIVMACYNAEKFLDIALDSILGQTYKNFEFIIVYDNSADRTLEILLRYAQKDGRIKIVQNSIALGLCGSLNMGIRLSQGKYIARMDADDIALPTRLEKQVSFFEAHPDVAVLGSFIQIIEGDSEISKGVREYPTKDYDLKRFMFFFSPFANSSVMMRKSVFSTAGCYDEKYGAGEDLDLWFRAGEEFKFANLPEVLLKYRIHPESLTHSKLREMEIQSNNLRLRYLRNPAFSAGICAYIYNYFHLLSIYLIPSKIKLMVFRKLRD